MNLFDDHPPKAAGLNISLPYIPISRWPCCCSAHCNITYKTSSGDNLLKYGFCNKSFWKDETLTSWTNDEHFFSTYLSSKLDYPSPMFWLEENLILSNVLIKEEYNFDEKYVEKSVLHWFNWSEFHLSKMTCYKIHTLAFGLSEFVFRSLCSSRTK